MKIYVKTKATEILTLNIKKNNKVEAVKVSEGLDQIFIADFSSVILIIKELK